MGKLAAGVIAIPLAIVIFGGVAALYVYKKANEIAGDYFFGEKPKK